MTYEEACELVGITLEESKSYCDPFYDVVPQPPEERVLIKPSEISGYGVWGLGTKITIYKGENRTLAGRFLNFGDTTGDLAIEGDSVVLYPNVPQEQEVLLNYIEAAILLKEINDGK